MKDVMICVRGAGRRKWLLKKCKVCDGWGRISEERKQITKEQAEAWGYNSLVCPECDGAGYLKEHDYIHKIGDMVK